MGTIHIEPLGLPVMDFYDGSTHIKIYDDDCRDETKEEIDSIAFNISNIFKRANKESDYNNK